MKKLLVLTDFTANATHAETAALHLAVRLGDGVLLYHTLPYIPLIPNDSGGPYMAATAGMLFEDSKERLMQEADKLREIAVMTPGQAVSIEEKNGEGRLGDVINELTADPEIEMVIMGGRSGGALEHIFSGSDTSVIIRKALKPVLIIPAHMAWDIPHNLVFATDFGIADIPAVSYLKELSSRLEFTLHTVHIVRQSEVVTEIGAEVAFLEYLHEQQLNYTQVFAGNVHEGLRKYCDEQGAALLAMTHDQHSFISRLFRQSESMAAITDQTLPVLVFPPGFQFTRINVSARDGRMI